MRGGETGEMSPDFMDWLHFKSSVQIGRDVKRYKVCALDVK